MDVQVRKDHDRSRYELTPRVVARFPRERARQGAAVPVMHFEETR